MFIIILRFVTSHSFVRIFNFGLTRTQASLAIACVRDYSIRGIF